MFKHNLLITYRGFLRNRTPFLINLIGLSTGLACALLIYLWVADELSIDQIHENDGQLYQVMTNFHGPDIIDTWEITPVPLAEAFRADFPEVESATLTNNTFLPKGKISHEGQSFEAKRMFADEHFFDVFSYDLIQGNSEQVLVDKSQIVISEELAIKLFNSTSNAVGRMVEWNNPYEEANFQISGIFENLPASSSHQFDALIHYDMLVQEDPEVTDWHTNAAETYLVLKKGASIAEFNERIEFFMWSKVPQRKTNTLFVQQYSHKYLHGRYENGVPTGGRITYVRLFSIIGLFILLIACINFMNLSTAQASGKMKEIGVKKAIGGSRKALILQFLSESLFMVILSLIAAVGWVLMLLPQFNEITGKHLQLNMGPGPVLFVAIIVIFTGLVAGSYPAFYLSGFNSVAVLKGKRNASVGEQWVRKGLVVFQFALSVFFIVGVLVVDQQIQYTQTKNLGYSRDNIISFQRPHHDGSEVFLASLQNIHGVVNAATMARSIVSGKDDQGGYSWNGDESNKAWIFKSPMIGYGVIETLGMEMVQGRSFSRDFQDDDAKIIINESALEMMQLENPLGTIVKYGDGRFREIIGVVSDFHYGSLHHEVKPLIFRLHNQTRGVLAKIKAGSEKTTIEQVEKLYAEFYPDFPFEFTFLDDEYQHLYESETRVAQLSKYFALLVIIISCLGLFGLAAFTAEKRTKEIGIRKVLGASVWGIVKLLSADFTKMVSGGILIALPISYLIASYWLEGFAYKIELSWWFFGGAALITLIIAWIVVGFQTFKAASTNPVNCLQHE